MILSHKPALARRATLVNSLKMMCKLWKNFTKQGPLLAPKEWVILLSMNDGIRTNSRIARDWWQGCINQQRSNAVNSYAACLRHLNFFLEQKKHAPAKIRIWIVPVWAKLTKGSPPNFASSIKRIWTSFLTSIPPEGE